MGDRCLRRSLLPRYDAAPVTQPGAGQSMPAPVDSRRRPTQQVNRCRASAIVDADYRDRSPVFHLSKVDDLPVSLWAGVEDGHSGSVPIRHSLAAFNAIAEAHGDPRISEQEISELSTQKQLTSPQASDQEQNESLGAAIFLHRQSGPSCITIFAGGHESHPDAALEWLNSKRRPVQ